MTTLDSGAAPRARLPGDSVAPVKAILKPQAPVLGVRKSRDEQGDEIPDSPTKRRKTVMFDDSLNSVHDIRGKTLEDTKRQVRQALERHAIGEDEDYNVLKDIFDRDRKARKEQEDEEEGGAEDSLNPQELLSYIVALAAYAPSLGKSCSGLVNSVLSFEWLARDEVFSKAYVQFLAALSSAKGSYLAQILSMIVGRFSDARPPRDPPRGYAAINTETMRERLHLGLQYLLELFPGARPVLLNLITAKFPYSDDSKKSHVAYVDNLLRLKQYSPDPRDIMELITSRAVKLDVEMQLDLEDMDDDITMAVMLQLKPKEANEYHEDGDGDESDTESLLSDVSDLDEEAVRILTMKSHVEKLDCILDTLFEVYNPCFSNPDSAEAIACYEDMLSDFSNIVLPTYKSRHSQFLVFYFGQKSARLTEMFVGTLFNIAFESNRPSVVKQSAVAYLASFVARGARVDSDQVQTIARTLLNYMDHHRINYEPECNGPDIRRYSQFYALSQGLIYLFCFRWRDLIHLDLSSSSIDRDDPASFLGKELHWMEGLKTRLMANIYSKLNPLKVCSPAIVQEFAKLSHHLGLMYVYPRLESNKLIQLSQFVGTAYSTGGALRDTGLDPQDEKWTHLDPYFPFDPYQLPGLFRRRLEEEQMYVPWTSIPGLNRDEDNESDDGGGDDEEEDGDVEEATATDEEG